MIVADEAAIMVIQLIQLVQMLRHIGPNAVSEGCLLLEILNISTAPLQKLIIGREHFIAILEDNGLLGINVVGDAYFKLSLP